MRSSRVGFILLLLLAVGFVDARAQARVVTGQVTHATTTAPIASVQVLVRGTTISTVTDEDGAFTIGVPAGNTTLIIRRIGYKRQEIAVSGGTSTVQVTLEADVLRLDEVVVSGQATGMQRRNLPNAISTVSAAEVSV